MTALGRLPDDDQDTFDDLLSSEERLAWARRRRCRHCYVWVYDAKADRFAVACAHGCGAVRHAWTSIDPDGDMRRVKASREAFVIAHANGTCPRDENRAWQRARRTLRPSPNK